MQLRALQLEEEKVSYQSIPETARSGIIRLIKDQFKKGLALRAIRLIREFLVDAYEKGIRTATNIVQRVSDISFKPINVREIVNAEFIAIHRSLGG